MAAWPERLKSLKEQISGLRGASSCRDESYNRMLPLLVGHGYFLRNDPKQLARGKPYPPLATLQVAALLRSRGHGVQLFDAMLAGGLDDYLARLAASPARVLLLYEDNFNFLT